MFTDTPKLQPISTSRNNNNKVPSSNGNQNSSNNKNHTNANTNNNNSGGNNYASKYNGDSYSKGDFKDSNSSQNDKRE